MLLCCSRFTLRRTLFPKIRAFSFWQKQVILFFPFRFQPLLLLPVLLLFICPFFVSKMIALNFSKIISLGATHWSARSMNWSSNCSDLFPTGIPYAAAPVGKLRFMPPVTPDHWTGVRSADRPGHVCPQKIQPPRDGLNESQVSKFRIFQKMQAFLVNQSEDCLYLNIYGPVSGEWAQELTNETEHFLMSTVERTWPADSR